MDKYTDIAVVGAGPYGLAAAAHLVGCGLSVTVFGEPMSFWERHMPKGLVLRSPWVASQISDPKKRLTLESYQSVRRSLISRPIPAESFVSYGKWFQREAVREIDRRSVARIEAADEGFRLRLEDGDEVRCRRVVVAAGIAPFAARPDKLAGLPRGLGLHSIELTTPQDFSGRDVLVVGGGQSALECAALLKESGARVEILARQSSIFWTWQRPWLHRFPFGPCLYAWPDVGPAFVSHFVARPRTYRLLSRSRQDRWASRSLRATGAGWLKPRVRDIPLWTGRAISGVRVQGSRIEAQLDDGTRRMVDHIVMGTGFRVDISKYSFLSGPLLSSVEQANGCPRLDAGFQSSVRGLYFLGAPASLSFGPLMRFVAGTEFAARSLAHHIFAARRKEPSRGIVSVPARVGVARSDT